MQGAIRLYRISSEKSEHKKCSSVTERASQPQSAYLY